MRVTYKLKYNFKRENQVILLMITDGKKWHYLAVKRLSALLRRITSNHNGDFYCLNCFHSHSTKNKLKEHEKVCNDHDYCYLEMPNEDNKMLKYNHGEKLHLLCMLTWIVCLKKCTHVKIIPKNLIQE